MPSYSQVLVDTDMYHQICYQWSLDAHEFAEMLWNTDSLMMGSAALSSIMNEPLLNDIDIFVDSAEAFDDFHHFLIAVGYYLKGNNDLSEYSAMSLRHTGNFKVTVYKYELPGNITGRDIQIIWVSDVQEARDLVDIAAAQASFDGKRWMLPTAQIGYLAEKKTWLNYDPALLSGYEKFCRVQKYEDRGFDFIEKPEEDVDGLMDAMENMSM